MKKLKQYVTIELGINEALDCLNEGNDYLRYSGMPSNDRFALTEHDGTGGRFLNQMYFPAHKAVETEIEIHKFGEGYDANIRVFRVKDVNPERIVLEYLGRRKRK